MDERNTSKMKEQNMIPTEVKTELKKYNAFPNIRPAWNEKTKRWGFLAYEWNKGSYWVGWMIGVSKAPKY
jgi:hypothetical protein